ncbi:alpha/beta fold hydrolase [Streptomyces sp. LP11]|uniref:Alpha/beta fold hydrolase n=1 Tax=Streptomyces pyxinicus TaxID=2970331 RepID=A0ABT2B1E8_9ACTN|nr:alpha/beta fold hydrolase [Streptomyces sp. LP11]MCS0602294.1 alpha/beta fold hydrolase [Streptomyces sp. LP11]
MSGLAVDGERWIRRYHPAPEDGPARPRLVCFPHAGGSASYFHTLSGLLHPHVEVLAVQYPGRQDRMAEPVPEDLTETAGHIAAALAPWTGGRLGFFGHSMGAVLAFEVSQRVTPEVLFASGGRAPSTRRDEPAYRLDDAGLVAEAELLGGTDATLLADPDLRELILPPLRADYRALAAHRSDPDAVIDAPIEVLVGDRDPRVTETEAAAWSVHTSRGSTLRVFPDGNHFYLADRWAELAELIGAWGARDTADR